MSGILKPEDYLGFKIGTDRKLADWPQIVEYFMKISRSSDRVKVDVLGDSTEGNPFIRAIVSSEENLKNLEEIRNNQQKFWDPMSLSEDEEKELLEKGKTIVLITCSIHSTEIAASQMSLELLHHLAASETKDVEKILDNVVLLLVPSLNPDGHQMVVKWYNEHLGTQYEGSSPPWMYHKYAGHDNNRDWFMLTQKENHLTVTEIHNKWHPQIVYDLHQMGRTGSRFFVPPYKDPIDTNIDPVLQSQSAFMGLSMLNDLTIEGKKGVWVAQGFDLWTPARHYQCYHGGIRILSEAASVEVASPIMVKKSEITSRSSLSPNEQRWNNPYPWNGGSWKLGDIVDYEFSAALAVIRNAARYKDKWLAGSLEVYKRAFELDGAPYAYIFPPNQKDPSSMKVLLNTLITGDVKVYRSKQEFKADGIQYPTGTYVIPLTQAFGRYAKTLLEIQKYPDLRDSPDQPPKRPYDVTAHTMPLTMHVDAYEVREKFDTPLEEITVVELSPGKIIGSGKYYAFTPEWNIAYKAANILLKDGAELYRSSSPLDFGNIILPAGLFLAKSDHEIIEKLAAEYGLTFYRVDALPEITLKVNTPRIGIYRAWSSAADEGWTRFVLENYDFTFESLSPQDMKQGNLSEKYDVILFPDYARSYIIDGMEAPDNKFTRKEKYPSKYRIGIGRQGVDEVLRFLKSGGVVVTVNGSCEFAIKDLSAPATNVLEAQPPTEFYIPGSILRVVFDETHPIGYGMSRDEAILFRNSPAFDIKWGERIANYPEANPLLSGWILGDKHLYGQNAVADLPIGEGRVILIGFQPVFRSQTHGTFKVLFNALLYAVEEPS